MKASLFKSISLMAFLVATTPVMADPVVAVVDGQKFTYSQVMEAKSALPKQYQSAPDDKLFPVLLNQTVDTYLINKAAQASGEANKPEVKQQIAKATEALIAQAYLLSKVKNTISDAAVQAKYNEVIKNFPKEEEVHLYHIVVGPKEKDVAVSVIKALKGGADFKKLAQAKSKDGTAHKGGDLGFVRKGDLPEALGNAAFNMKAGTFSEEPVFTDFGWHVLKVEERRDAKPPAFDEVKNEIKTLMMQEAVVALVKDLRSKSKIELFDKNGKPLPAQKPEAAKAGAPAVKTTPSSEGAPAGEPGKTTPPSTGSQPAAPSTKK